MAGVWEETRTRPVKKGESLLEQLDLDSSVPIYTQIEKQVRFGVASGKLKSGDQLPSARELAERFGVSMMTVVKAYRDLQLMGWVNSRRNMGVFIAKDCEERCRADTHQQILQQISELLADAKAAGMTQQMITDTVEKTFAE